MADSPAAATHALTMKGAQISWAILAGHKIIENRHMRMRPGWYLLHTGKGSQDAAHQEKMRGIVGAALPAEADLPHGVVVGALHVVRSLRPEECQGSVWASGPFCNVVGASCTLATPVAAQGSLGLWKPGPAVLEHVRAQLIDAPVLRNDVAHLLRAPPSAEEVTLTLTFTLTLTLTLAAVTSPSGASSANPSPNSKVKHERSRAASQRRAEAAAKRRLAPQPCKVRIRVRVS